MVITTASPRQLLIQINIPTIGPIPIIRATDSTGTFSCARRKEVRITPEPGTPGAPNERITMVAANETSIPADALTPQIFASAREIFFKKEQGIEFSKEKDQETDQHHAEQAEEEGSYNPPGATSGKKSPFSEPGKG